VNAKSSKQDRPLHFDPSIDAMVLRTFGEDEAMNENALILIVEDERQIAEIYQAFFEREGFRVVTAHDGEAGLDLHRMLSPDLVVLDIGLPKRDGVEVLGEIRRRGNSPVIMSTALGEDLEKLTALKIGADDYLVKPFNPLELVARARAVLRRATDTNGRGNVIRVGALEVDMVAHEIRAVVKDDAEILEVTPTEFRIVSHMARAPRKAFARSEILDACLPQDGNALERTVDSHISNLRMKFERVGIEGMLPGVRGVGYRLASS
jgi:two-component system, OmpR family, response regulator AdeR